MSMFLSLIQVVTKSLPVETLRVFDTTRIVDTIGIVATSPTSTGLIAAQILVAVATVGASVAAAIASWRAASASKENAEAAAKSADAAFKQAAASEAQAKAQIEQISLLRETERASLQRRALASKALARRIRIPLKQLTVPGPRHREAMSYSLLDDADIAQLEALAPSVDDEAIALAGKAATALRIVSGLLKKGKGINEGTGWSPSADEAQNWQFSLEAADEMLVKFEDVCDRVAAS